MPFRLQAIDRTRISGSIADQILDGVQKGAFPAGKPLPAERLLAERLGVSRGSVREAIRVLEQIGIVEARMGSGTFVVDGGSGKVAVLRAQLALIGEHSPLDVIVARRAVEPTCARLAATVARASDVDLIRDTVGALARLADAGEDGFDADLEFHLAVAGAAGNPVLLLLVERLVAIMRRSPWSDLKHASRLEPEGALRDVREHRAVLDAIAARDADGAERAMLDHLASVERDLHAQVS